MKQKLLKFYKKHSTIIPVIFLLAIIFVLGYKKIEIYKLLIIIIIISIIYLIYEFGDDIMKKIKRTKSDTKEVKLTKSDVEKIRGEKTSKTKAKAKTNSKKKKSKLNTVLFVLLIIMGIGLFMFILGIIIFIPTSIKKERREVQDILF